MKHMILGLITTIVLMNTAFAQVATIPTTMPTTVSFAGDIRKQADNYMELRNGHTYYVEDNMVIERVNVDSAGFVLYNIFDFQNQIVFHKSDSNNLGFSNSPFSAIPAQQLKDVKDYGCYIAKAASTAGPRTDDPRASYYFKYCSN